MIERITITVTTDKPDGGSAQHWSSDVDDEQRDKIAAAAEEAYDSPFPLPHEVVGMTKALISGGLLNRWWEWPRP